MRIATGNFGQKSKKSEMKSDATKVTSSLNTLTRSQKGYIDAIIQGTIIGVDINSTESPPIQIEKQIKSIIEALNNLQKEGEDYRILSLMFNKPSEGLKGIEKTTGSEIRVSIIKQYLLDLVNNEIQTVVNQTISGSEQQTRILQNWDAFYKEKSQQIKSADPELFKSDQGSMIEVSTVIEDAKLEARRRYLHFDIVEEKEKIITTDEKLRQEIEEDTDKKIEYAVIRPALFTTKEPLVEFKILTPASTALLEGKEIKSADIFAAQRFYETTLPYFYFDLVKNMETLCSDKIFTIRVTQTKPGEPFRFTVNFPPLLEDGPDKPGTILSITSPILSQDNLEVFFRSKIEGMENELPSQAESFKESQFHEAFIRIAKYLCSQIKNEDITPPLKKLIVNQNFYQLFETKKLNLMDFVGINLEQVNLLIKAAPDLNNLLERGIIFSKELKTLTQQQINNYNRLLKLFENEIRNNTISSQIIRYLHEQDSDALLQIKLNAFEKMKQSLMCQSDLLDKVKDKITPLESKCTAELKHAYQKNLVEVLKNNLEQLLKKSSVSEAMERVQSRITLRSAILNDLMEKRAQGKRSNSTRSYDDQIQALCNLIPTNHRFYQRFVELLADRIQTEWRQGNIWELNNAVIIKLFIKETDKMLESCALYSSYDQALSEVLVKIHYPPKAEDRDALTLPELIEQANFYRSELSRLAEYSTYDIFLNAMKSELINFCLTSADRIDLERPNIESNLHLCSQIHEILKQQKELKHSASESAALNALIEQPENTFNSFLVAAIAVRKAGEKIAGGKKDYPLTDLGFNRQGLLKMIQEKVLTKEHVEISQPEQLQNIITGAEIIKDRSPALKALFIQGVFSIEEILMIPPSPPDSFVNFDNLPIDLINFKLEAKETLIKPVKESKDHVLDSSKGSHNDLLKSNLLTLANKKIIDETDIVSIFKEPRALALLKRLSMNSSSAGQLQHSIVEQLCCDSISRRLDTLSDLDGLAKACHVVGLKSVADLIERKKAVVAILNALEACVQTQDIWGNSVGTDAKSDSNSGWGDSAGAQSDSNSGWDNDGDFESPVTLADSFASSTSFTEGLENYKQFVSRISNIECDNAELKQELSAILAETEKEATHVAKPKPSKGPGGLFAPRREINELQMWGKLFDRLMAKASKLRSVMNLESGDPRLATLDAAISHARNKLNTSQSSMYDARM